MSLPSQYAKLGIIAGGGAMPLAVAAAAAESGRPIHIIGIRGEAKDEIENYPHSWTKWGKVGQLFKILEREQCKDIVIIGNVSRPDLTKFSVDFGTITNLPFILSLTIGGDDSILSGIVKFFENKGFNVIGAHEVAPGLLAPEGLIGCIAPKPRDEEDIQLGFQVIEALGNLDVGQAVIVSRGYVLGVEAAEGTDAMIQRCANLKQWGVKFGSKRAGVLVKGFKPTQEKRIDMPTIGPKTLEHAAKAGLSGIAVRAGGVLLADQDDLVKAADKHGLFLFGVPFEDQN